MKTLKRWLSVYSGPALLVQLWGCSIALSLVIMAVIIDANTDAARVKLLTLERRIEALETVSVADTGEKDYTKGRLQWVTPPVDCGLRALYSGRDTAIAAPILTNGLATDDSFDFLTAGLTAGLVF